MRGVPQDSDPTIRDVDALPNSASYSTSTTSRTQDLAAVQASSAPSWHTTSAASSSPRHIEEHLLTSMSASYITDRHLPYSGLSHSRGYPPYGMTPVVGPFPPAANTPTPSARAPRLPMVASAISHAYGAPLGELPHHQPPVALVPQQVAFCSLNPGSEMAQQVYHDIYSLTRGSQSISPAHAVPSASSAQPSLGVTATPRQQTVDTALLASSHKPGFTPYSGNIHDFALPEGDRPYLGVVYRQSPSSSPNTKGASDILRPNEAPLFKPYFPSDTRSDWGHAPPSISGEMSAQVPGVRLQVTSNTRDTPRVSEAVSDSSFDSPSSAATSLQRLRHTNQPSRPVSASANHRVNIEFMTRAVPSPSEISRRVSAPESEENEEQDVLDDHDRNNDSTPSSQCSPRKRVRHNPGSYQPPLKRVCTDNSLVALFEKYPSLPNRFPLFCFALEHDLSFHEPAVPMIKSLSQALSPLQKCEELKKLWHKGRRILAQLDAFVARCERKVIRPNDEKLPELDESTRRAVRQVRRKIVERCENYKYTRRDTLNKHIGKNRWEPIETGMVEWYEGMADNDPANDLRCFMTPSPANFTTTPISYTDRNSAVQPSTDSLDGPFEDWRNNVFNELSSFTPQVPQLPQNPLPRSASDTPQFPSELQGQLRPGDRYSDLGVGTSGDSGRPPLRSAISDSGSDTCAVPCSGTPTASAKAASDISHSPSSPRLEVPAIPTPNCDVPYPLDELAAPPDGDLSSTNLNTCSSVDSCDSSPHDTTERSSSLPTQFSQELHFRLQV